MRMDKRSFIKVAPYGGLAVALAIIFYYVFRTQELKDSFETIQVESERINGEVNELKGLLALDSLLLDGDYEAALKAYQGESQDAFVTTRIAIARKLIRQKQEILDIRAVRDSVSIDSTIVSISATPFEVRQYDSISFALQKAQLQIEKLNGQLKQRSFGEYLEFKSQKGNTIYYVGQIKKGKANGKGVALFNTGSRYTGEWKDNMRHGEGSFYWPDGQYYIGEYVNNNREGKGTYYWPNGEKFVGDWKKDQRSGQGSFYSSEGEIVASGIWEDDELVKVNKK